MKTTNSRKLQAAQTKEKLLDCSLEMVKTYGYDNAKITEICEQTGVSVGAFYHHFKNKEGIIVEGYSKCDNYFETEVMKKLSSQDIIDKILEYLTYQAKYAEDLGLELITQVYKSQVTHGTEFFLSIERALPKNLLKLIASAQEEGRITSDIEATEIRDELLIISRGCIYNWCQSKAAFNLSNKILQMAARYLHFFKSGAKD